jgi:hypothetical protein
MQQITQKSDTYIQNNLFLQMAVMSTSMFDYFSYACGVGKVSGFKFTLSLVVSRLIVVSTFVALGAGIVQGSLIVLIAFGGFAMLGAARVWLDQRKSRLLTDQLSPN